MEDQPHAGTRIELNLGNAAIRSWLGLAFCPGCSGAGRFVHPARAAATALAKHDGSLQKRLVDRAGRRFRLHDHSPSRNSTAKSCGLSSTRSIPAPFIPGIVTLAISVMTRSNVRHRVDVSIASAPLGAIRS